MIYTDEKVIAKKYLAKELKSPILIYGPEEYLKQNYVKKLTLSEQSAFSSFNAQVFDFENMDMQQLAEALSTPPFMAERKSVLVYNVAPKDISSEQFKNLEDLFSELYPDCVAVFLEKSGSVDEKKEEKSKKLIRLFDRYGSVLQFKEYTESELIKLARSDIQKEGSSIAPEALTILLERTGRNLIALKNEISKLCAYKKGEQIESLDVEILTAPRVEDNIYGLSRMILRGRYEEAMRILDGLFYLRYPTESILGTLSQCYIDLYRAQAAIKSGKRVQDICNDFSYGRRSFVVENAMRDVKNLTEEELNLALSALQKADIILKSTQADARTVLEQTITTLFLRKKK